MEILARFNHDKINHTVDNNGHLVLSLVAPPLAREAQRPKLAVLPVIDLSGSMRGPKLEYAKRSLRKLVDHLSIGDVCGLAAFESDFHLMVPPEAVTSEFKEKLRSAIDKLHIRGGTNYLKGLQKSIEAMKGLDLPLSFIQRIIFFTDGQPTEGVTNKDVILKSTIDEIGSSNVTVSFFGYGSVGGGAYDGCDQDFLVLCSQNTKGNYAYVADPDAALGAFGKELGGLLSAYASDIRISIEPVNGHQVTQVVSDVEAEEEDVTGQVEVKLSDLIAEETRHIVLSTKLLKQNQAFPRPATIFNVKVIYSVISTDGKKETKTEDIKARVQFVKADEAQKEPNKEVDAIVGLAQMVRAQITAEEKAKGGDYKTAGAILEQMSHQLHNRGHGALGAVSRKLSASVSSQAQYAASSGYLSSMKSGGTRSFGVSSMDAEALADLVGTGTVSTNSVMDNMVRSFTSPDIVQPAVVAPAPAFQEPLIQGLSGPAQGLSWVAPDVVTGGGEMSWASPVGSLHANPPLWVPPQSSPECPAVAETDRKPIRQRKSKTRW